MKRYILPLILLITLITSFLPLPVYALTQDRIITGAGSDTEGTYVGAPGTWANLNSNDGDTSYVRSEDLYATKYNSYDMEDFVIGTGINGVTLTTSIKSTGGVDSRGSAYGYVKIGGTRYLSTAHSLTTSYQTFTDNTFGGVTNKNPATGTDWTFATLNAAEWGIELAYGYTNTGGAPPVYVYFQHRCSYLKITVDYTSPTVPTITTNTATISANTTHCFVTMNGEITADGGADITQRGFEWGTTSNTTTPASTQPPLTTPYTTNWTEGSTDWGTGTYTYTTNLTCCSTYYYRAYSRNSAGWGWGSEQTFTMMCEPDITTVAATYIAATTARLNSVVVNDGGQLCDVRFFYSTITGNCTDLASCAPSTTCNATSYNGTTPWVSNTYATGDTPYVDLSGLVSSKTYYFCSMIQNDHACACGGQLSFTTSSGINEPTNFKGIARPTEISLFWNKGTGSSSTLVRGKIGGYPSGILDGTEVYNDVQTSVVWNGLTSGTTYYFRAWGYSGGTFSTSNATLMLTTLGSTGSPGTMPAPTTPTDWYQAPTYTTMSNLPWYGMVNFFADSFEIPRSTLWFMSAMVMVLIAGVLTYNYGGQKILLADIVCVLGVGLAVKMGLAGMWLLVPFIIILFACIALGERL